eukprot:scaffold25055_cov106-Isochrysis_galbana.AAC.1
MQDRTGHGGARSADHRPGLEQRRVVQADTQAGGRAAARGTEVRARSKAGQLCGRDLVACGVHPQLAAGVVVVVVVPLGLAPQGGADGAELAPVPARLAWGAQRHASVLRHAHAAQHRTGRAAEARGRDWAACWLSQALARGLAPALGTRVGQLSPLRHRGRRNGLAPRVDPHLASVTLKHRGVVALVAPQALAHRAVLAVVPPPETAAAQGASLGGRPPLSAQSAAAATEEARAAGSGCRERLAGPPSRLGCPTPPRLGGGSLGLWRGSRARMQRRGGRRGVESRRRRSEPCPHGRRRSRSRRSCPSRIQPPASGSHLRGRVGRLTVRRNRKGASHAAGAGVALILRLIAHRLLAFRSLRLAHDGGGGERGGTEGGSLERRHRVLALQSALPPTCQCHRGRHDVVSGVLRRTARRLVSFCACRLSDPLQVPRLHFCSSLGRMHPGGLHRTALRRAHGLLRPFFRPAGQKDRTSLEFRGGKASLSRARRFVVSGCWSLAPLPVLAGSCLRVFPIPEASLREGRGRTQNSKEVWEYELYGGAQVGPTPP